MTGRAVGVLHVPEVLPHQFRLAGMHEAAALAVVHEKVTVDAEAELAQFFQDLLLCALVSPTVVIQRGDQALRHLDIVLQLRALARQDAVFDQLRLLIAQLAIERDHQGADDRDGQDQRQNPEGDDFVFEQHLYSCPDSAGRRMAASYAKPMDEA